ncbi:HD domain-containing phosphohydrolase [Sneathiella limimaris]|uniref:HD domain-containing phosphohydrolase n=1 Tax=Sneathiella limimaris TaxID=1964213 RepID=UPI00146CE759|nr:HD domain-containing phosphohydrolase [Sneathiella limimaris]
MSDIKEEISTTKRTHKVIGFAIFLLLVVVIGGIWGTITFVNQQRERDLQNWEIRLGIVADSRLASVEEWLAKQKEAIISLAENESLQVYLTQLVIDTEDNGTRIEEVPEAGYLTNLLNNHAVISGFWEAPEPEIRANVARPGRAGIALMDATGKLLVSSGNMPPMTPEIRAAMAQADSGVSAVIDLYEGLDGEPIMGFVHPVYAIQQDGDAENIIGFIVGVRTVAKSLFPRLYQPGETHQTSETYLVRKNGNLTEYISPLADGTGPLKRRLTTDESRAASFVIENPGAFGRKQNYLADEVLVTGRAVTGAPWFLVRSITTFEALSESQDRLNTMLGVFLLLILGVTGTVVAVWRHGTSIRAAELAEKYKKTADSLQEQSNFLNVVTDSQPTGIAVFSDKNRFTFANKVAADAVEMPKDAVVGRRITTVYPPVVAEQIQKLLHQAGENNQNTSELIEVPQGEEDHIWKSDIIPLGANKDQVNSFLAVFQDITDVVTEREQREAVLRNLVTTLVAFLDRRDPYSANQSSRVAEVGVAIAEELGSTERVIRTVDIAGNLMNLGKILVPTEILTKAGNLTTEEMEIVRDSLFASADLLEEVKFNLPVAETLRQLQEHWDGTGKPRGLKETAINEAARIIMVANAFVGMVSPRAYRDAFDFSKAVGILMEDADKRYDRRPISALINYLDNRGGRDRWAHYSNPPEAN